MNYMNSITQGVYVIGSKNDSCTNLMTAAWLTQVSSRPDTVLVAVSAGHYTAEIMQENPNIVISVLAEGQEDIAKACGFVSGRKKDKTALVPCRLNEKGLPEILEAAAILKCRVKKVFKEGDHILFLAEAEDGLCSGKSPLIYHSAVYF
jgi:flavin reductase (DIM6/NTAB) family NADH-FMN oxidoreductase RutF